MKCKLSLIPGKRQSRRRLPATLFLVLLLLGVRTSAQTDYTIGANNGTTLGGYPCPFQDLYEGSRQQFLYRAADLAAAGMTTAGNITAIKFNVLDLYTTGIVEDYTVKIKQVSLTALTLTGWEEGATTVYGPVNYQPVNGVNTLTFSSPFAWDGTSAILIEVCNGGSNWTDNVNVAYTSVTGVQLSRIYRADGSGSLCGYTGTAVSGQTATTRIRRPIATFTVVVPQPCSGAPTIGAAQSSASTLTCSGTTQLSLASYPQNLTGIVYKWQSSPAGMNNWTDISGNLTTPAYTTGTINDNTDFRAVATCSGSPTTSNTVTVNVTKISATPLMSTICDGNAQTLAAVSPLPTNPILYSQNFNNGTGDLTFVNTTTGGINANAAWTIQADGYTDQNGYEFHSPTNTSFIISNSDLAGNGANVHTEMITPAINTNGYATLSLTFNHHKANFLGAVSTARVQISTDGGTVWSTLPDGLFSGGSNIGTSSNFIAVTCNLNAYINSSIRLRWVYDDVNWNFFYAVDDILVSGTSLPAPTYTWSSTDPGAGLPGVVNTPSISVVPTNGAGSYVYTVTSNNCGAATATVDVVPGPVATITAGAPICEGQPATISFTGNPGDVITFNTTESVTLDGSGEATYTASGLTAGSYVYTINTIANTTCTVASTLSATQVVNARPQGVLVGATTVCKDIPAYISFGSISTDFPIDVTLSDGLNTYNRTATSSAENFVVPSDVAGVFTYEITALSDVNGCNAIGGDFSGTSTVTVNDRPSVVVSSDDPGVCEGGSTNVTITFNGAAPYDFTYFDGTGSVVASEPTNTFVFSVSPTAATTYNVEYLEDANTCIALPTDLVSSATVVIYDTVAIVTQPASASACSQTSATITMAATGNMLTYAWFENGVPVPVDPNYTVNGNSITINNVSGLTGNEYYAVVSGTCGLDQTSDPATLTEDFNNTWDGSTDNSWAEPTNWSCGVVPTMVTNAIIANVPNFCTVDIATAECNNLTIDLGASVLFSNTTNKLSIHGDVQNNGTFNGNNGTISLAGAGAQQVSGAITFDDLEIEGGGTKVINGVATVNGELILTDGYLALGNNNLIIKDMTLQNGGNANSYVLTDGTGELVGQNMGANPTLFPVGTTTSYNPVMIENTGDADTFMVRVMNHVYVDGVGTNPEQVDNPVVDRTWMISEQTDGGSFATVTPYWSAGEEINGFDQSHVYVPHFMGGLWTSPVDSTLFTPAAVAVGSMWTAMEDSITSFSPFTVASHGDFPLSIRLTSIAATNVDTRNKVEWKSATEDAGDMYELESSTDGRKFIKIATVAAKGQASTYTQWDATPAEGVNYYRVKLLSTDGKFSYSKVVTATVNKTGSFTIEAYPNPVHNTVSVKVNGVVSGKGSVVVTDVTGKVVSQVTVVEHNSAELNVSHLANGMYLLNYSDDIRNESIKINKQ